MKYKDLRDFIAKLEARGELKRITREIDTDLEMTEIADRTLAPASGEIVGRPTPSSCVRGGVGVGSTGSGSRGRGWPRSGVS